MRQEKERGVQKILAAAALVVLASPAFAQSAGKAGIDSVRAPFSTAMGYSLSLQTMSVSAITGKLVANSGQTRLVGAVNLLKDSVILAEIPGPKTAGTQTVVVAIRAIFTVTGGVGWDADPITVRAALPNVVVPAGATLALRYDMPVQTTDTTPASGTLQWLVGVGAKASAIAAPVTPGPVVIGPITPPPAPAPAPAPDPTPTPTGTSADGTTIPPAIGITDAAGDVWKFSGTHPQKNGAETGGSGGVLMTIKAGIVYFEQGPLVTGQWWKWTGTGWAPSAAP